MKPKTSPPPKSKSAKAAPAKSKTNPRSLESVVGPEVYGSWVAMLRVLVPDGRTHRLAPLVAAMLQYACVVAGKNPDDTDEHSLVQALLDSAEVSDPEEVEKLLHEAVTRLFKDAGVQFERTSARGQNYSVVETAYEEYIRWYDMPWE